MAERRGGGMGHGGGDRGRDRRPRGPEVESEWQEKVVQIRRVTKVVKGGKKLISVPLVGTTLPHPLVGEAGASRVLLRPASKGTGVIAGGAVRIVLELAGVKDVLSKRLGSDSPLGNARATIEALRLMRTVEQV